MIYNMPSYAIITSTLKPGIQAQKVNDPDDVDASQYHFKSKLKLLYSNIL